MKTGIERFFDLLTCRFLKIFFLACPQKASPVPILIFRVPPLPIFSFTKSLKIFSTSQIFCRFSYLATMTPETLTPAMPYPDTCHLTHDTRFARDPTPQARLPTTQSRLLIAQSQLPTTHSRLPMFPGTSPASATPEPLSANGSPAP